MTQAAPRAAERPLVLALDLGSGSLRASVYDRLGREVAGTEGRAPTEWRHTPDGGIEADPDALVHGACAAIDQALAGAGPAAADIRAVGISTFWHSMAGLDAAGRPATPLYSWADGRSGRAVGGLRVRLDEETTRRRTGCVFHTSYLPARLLWLRTDRPDLFAAARTWMGIGEYFTLRLFGRAACSISMASGTGMLDLRRCEWDDEVLGALGLSRERLSPLVDLDAPFIGLRPEYAARWPSLSRTPWLPAAGDGALANAGTGCADRGRAALSLGTSGAMRVMWSGDVPEVPRALWVYRLDRRRVLTGGAVTNGGSVYRWMLDTLAIGDPSRVEAALLERAPDAHGLTVLPFFSAERSPDWPVSSRAALMGLSASTQPLDLLQAGLEAVAYRLALVWDALSAAVSGVREIVASGGAFGHLPAWLRIFADVFGHDMVRSAEDEGSSRGAALLALDSLGAVRIEETPVPRAATVSADASRHAVYKRARARHAHAAQLLAPVEVWER